MRKLLFAIFVLIILLAGATLALFMYLDSAARTAVEKGGTYALGVNTTLKSADVKPLAGEFEMSELNVANPEGYQTSHFMTLGSGDVALSFKSLMEDTIRLPHLKLSTIDMNLEKKEGKANYQAIIDNLKKLMPEPNPDAKKMVIETVEITDIMVHVQVVGQNVNVPIDRITLKDVGSDGSGVDIAQLTGVVIKSIFAAAVQNGGGLIPTDMLGDLTSGLGELANLDKLGEIADLGELAGEAGEMVGEAGDAAQKAADEAKKKADELANKAKEGLGGILGGDGKKKDGGN